MHRELVDWFCLDLALSRLQGCPIGLNYEEVSVAKKLLQKLVMYERCQTGGPSYGKSYE